MILHVLYDSKEQKILDITLVSDSNTTSQYSQQYCHCKFMLLELECRWHFHQKIYPSVVVAQSPPPHYGAYSENRSSSTRRQAMGKKWFQQTLLCCNVLSQEAYIADYQSNGPYHLCPKSGNDVGRKWCGGDRIKAEQKHQGQGRATCC